MPFLAPLLMAGRVFHLYRPTPLFVGGLLLIAAGPRFRLPADLLLIVFAAPAAAKLGYWMFCSMKSRRLST